MSGYDRRDQARGAIPANGWAGASGTQPGACAAAGGARGGPVGGAPSAQELMMYADGELEPCRAAQVAAFVQYHPELRAKLARTKHAAGIVVAGMLERAHAGGADCIADAVMASIEAGAPVASLSRHRFRVGRTAWAARAAVAVSITVAVAAACTLLARSWLRHRGAVQLALESGASLGATSPSEAMSGMGGPIKIDAVDFGARAGSIFYVKKGDKTETPVLWVTDDDAGVRGGGSR